MANLPKIPYEIKNQIYYTLSEFGCARWKALLIYAEALSMRSGALPAEIREEHAEGAGYKAVMALLTEGRIEKAEYGDELVVVPKGSGIAGASFDSIYAFDAFAALVYEVAENDQIPEMCYAGKTENYPFHYIFAAAKQPLLYRVIVYGQDAYARIGFLNSTYVHKRDKKYITLLVVPEVYSWEEFTEVTIEGKSRIAFIMKANKGNKTHKCLLTEVIEEKKQQ